MQRTSLFHIILNSNSLITFGDEKRNCWQGWHTMIHIKIISNILVTTFSLFYFQQKHFSKKAQLQHMLEWIISYKKVSLKRWFLKHLKDQLGGSFEESALENAGKTIKIKSIISQRKNLKKYFRCCMWSFRKTNNFKNTLLEVKIWRSIQWKNETGLTASHC